MKRSTRSKTLLAAALLLAGAAPLAAGGKVNLNTASEEELEKLPDMNAAKAKAIVNYRKSTGEFIQVDELELIPQVKPSYAKLKDLVDVE